MAAVERMNAWHRFSHLRSVMANWPLIVPDKLGLVRTCRYRSRSGQTIECRPKSTDVNEAVVVLDGLEYPFEHLRLADGQVVVDIGANIGSFALLVDSLNPGIRYTGLAVEPMAETFSLLERNLAHNGIDRFRAVPAAISDVDGTVRMRVDLPADAARISNDGEGAMVRSLRLGTLCQQHRIERIDLLKVDIEGAEYGLVETELPFFRSSVRRVLMEYHPPETAGATERLLDTMRGDFVVQVLHSRESSGMLYAENRRL
jgi:FkbM family methyltransferase